MKNIIVGLGATVIAIVVGVSCDVVTNNAFLPQTTLQKAQYFQNACGQYSTDPTSLSVELLSPELNYGIGTIQPPPLYTGDLTLEPYIQVQLSTLPNFYVDFIPVGNVLQNGGFDAIPCSDTTADFATDINPWMALSLDISPLQETRIWWNRQCGYISHWTTEHLVRERIDFKTVVGNLKRRLLQEVDTR